MIVSEIFAVAVAPALLLRLRLLRGLRGAGLPDGCGLPNGCGLPDGSGLGGQFGLRLPILGLARLLLP